MSVNEQTSPRYGKNRRHVYGIEQNDPGERGINVIPASGLYAVGLIRGRRMGK
jgi:hypothetical protein